MTRSTENVLAFVYLVFVAFWLLLTTTLLTGILPGWGLNQPFVLVLLLVWVVAGGWYGAWKTKREFQVQAGFGWRACLSRACLTLSSNILVAAMAPPLLFITTSSILRNASKSIGLTSNETLASSLAWGSFGVTLAAAGVAFIVLNEHIHSAISRKVRMIQLESERTADSPSQSEGNRMIQAIKRKLKALKVPRTAIAGLAGTSPFILALIFVWARSSYTTGTSVIFQAGEWFKYLIQHQDAIIQTLIVSSVMVAVFCTLLRNKLATFLAAFQPGVIQAMFILTDRGQHLALNLPLAVITVLPLLVLLLTLGRDVGQQNDRDEAERRAH